MAHMSKIVSKSHIDKGEVRELRAKNGIHYVFIISCGVGMSNTQNAIKALLEIRCASTLMKIFERAQFLSNENGMGGMCVCVCFDDLEEGFLMKGRFLVIFIINSAKN